MNRPKFNVSNQMDESNSIQRVNILLTGPFTVNSEYDQEIPLSQTADKPMAPQGRAKQQSKKPLKRPTFWFSRPIIA